ESDLGTNTQIKHGEVMNLTLARRQTVGGTDDWLPVAGQLARPSFLGSDVGIFHEASARLGAEQEEMPENDDRIQLDKRVTIRSRLSVLSIVFFSTTLNQAA